MSTLDQTTTEQPSENTKEVANNMAMVFADQIRKGLIPWHVVPKALRSTVQALLDRGE